MTGQKFTKKLTNFCFLSSFKIQVRAAGGETQICSVLKFKKYNLIRYFALKGPNLNVFILLMLYRGAP